MRQNQGRGDGPTNGNSSRQRDLAINQSINESGDEVDVRPERSPSQHQGNNLGSDAMTQSQKQSSTKPKKSQKRREMNDSNSIDEEAFQDYFSNPQKRKEFDRHRLQQQMREIHNIIMTIQIAGFSLGQFNTKQNKSLKETLPSYQGAEIDVNNEVASQKNYATVSLCCLSVTNPFRNKIINLVAINPWFEKFILVVILVNCVFLAMDNEVDFVKNNSDRIDFVFLIIYTVEMLLKIIAMGFFMRAHSYLRDSWNILDFIVVIMGWVSIALTFSNIQGQDISSIRVIRILRPLRTINSIPGMSGLVQTILNSVPILIDIMILFAFMLIMFGTIATQLFGGKLSHRCAVKDALGQAQFVMYEGYSVFCVNDIDCKTRIDDRYSDLNALQMGSTCMPKKFPNFGTLSFDDILISMLNIFQVISLEGWTDIMYVMRDATDSRLYDIFFILCVLFGAFFVLNLMIAVQFTYLGEAFDEDERRQKELKERLNKKKKDRIDEELDDSFFEDDEEEEKNQKNKSCFRKNKECMALQKKVEEMINAPWFDKFIIIIIVINTLILASESYEQAEWFQTLNDISNYIFTVIFLLEMLLKMFGLGFKMYFQDGFNIFDFVVVMLSLVDVFQSAENSGLSVLRAFRLLRIFKIIRSWKQLRVLLTTVLASLSAITNLGFLTILYLFIFALLAKQFYGDAPLYDEDHQIARYDFQTTIKSLITVFIILTGENWNEIMVLVMNKEDTSKVACAIFFMSIVVIGNYMLLNLFLAILLKFISENSNDEPETNTNGASTTNPAQIEAKGDDDADENSSQNASLTLNSSNSNIEEEFEQIKIQLEQLSKMSLHQNKLNVHSNASKKIYEGGDSSSYSFESKKKDNEDKAKVKIDQNAIKDQKMKESKILMYAQKYIMKQKISKKKVIEIDENSRALYIFGHENWLRQKLKIFLENPYFEGFIYHMIAFNSLLLALDEPDLENKDPFSNLTIKNMLNTVSIIFVLEFVIKIIVYGFFIGPKTYMKDNFNKLDFIIVFFGIVNWILEAVTTSTDLSFVKGFRALRALRPLRVVSKNEGIKTVVNSLLKSLPSLMNVMLIVFLFLLVFGILGVQMFKGAVSYCNDKDPLILSKQMCVGMFMEMTTDQDGNEIATSTQREWITPIQNYNNIFNSMLTFFEICTLEMWPDRMYAAIDSTGVDLVPKIDNNLAFSLLFIIFIFLTSFFIMNLFISVIVDKFNEEIKKRQGSHKFTEEQKEWVKIQRLLVFTEPKIIPIEPVNCFRLQCFKMVQSQLFDYFVMAAILINTIFLCIDHTEKSDHLANILDISNTVFVVIFTLEMSFKIIAYGFKYYWHVNWNKFDFIIVWMSLITINENLLTQLSFNVTAFRIIRVSRLLRMIKTSKSLRQLLKTLYMSLGNILTTASLLCLILFTFTVAGMNLFSNVPFGDYIDKNANFKSFYLAMSTLWRACTGENWNGLMMECRQDTGFVAIVFWLTFQLITFFIFMNVFIAVIYENFNDIQASEDENDILSLKKKDIKSFQHVWAKFNPEGEHYMKTTRLPEFLRSLPPPLGYSGIRIEDSKLNKIIFCLNIRDHKGKVYYPEVMWSIFHSIVGINDEQVNNCEQIKNILKIVKRKYKDLSKKLSLDALCGNKYYRNELTAIKHIQAMKIIQRWRDFKEEQMKKKQQNVDIAKLNENEIEEEEESESRSRKQSNSNNKKKKRDNN